MAHFTAAGFTFQSSLRNSGVNKLKLSRPPEILLMREGIRRWRRREEGRQYPVLGRRRGKPSEVP